MHSYFNYENKVSASISRAKLKELAHKQKQVLRTANNEWTNVREIMIRMKVLNIYNFICIKF